MEGKYNNKEGDLKRAHLSPRVLRYKRGGLGEFTAIILENNVRENIG
jgi:hypothetical protein